MRWQTACIKAGMSFVNVSFVVRRSRFSVFGLILCSALMLFVQLPVRASQSITLTWNPSTTTNVAGYKIYAGAASHSYNTTNVTGTATNTTISGLVQGKTYYFAATTYDSDGDESVYSDEIAYTVPVAPATLGSPVRAGTQFQLFGFRARPMPNTWCKTPPTW